MFKNLIKKYVLLKKIKKFKITRNYFIDNLSLVPYQNLFFLLLFKKERKVSFKISSNLVNLRIRFYTSSKSNDFYEKIYYQKNGYFKINENYKRKIKYIFIFNPNACTHENIKFHITSLKKIFLFDLIDKEFKLDKKKELFVIYSLGKTGSTSLINNLSKIKAKCIKIHRLDNSYKKFLNKKEFSQLNLSNGWPLKQIKNFEQINKIGDLETILNQIYFEKYREKINKLIYITIYREITSLYISSQFEMFGNFFINKKLNNTLILNEFIKNLHPYLDYCEKWLKNYFKKFNINIQKIKKNKFVLKQSKKNIFYFCSIDEINKLYQIIENKHSLKKNLFRHYNVSNKKEYAIKYNLIKTEFLNKKKNLVKETKTKFKLIRTIEKKLKLD